MQVVKKYNYFTIILDDEKLNGKNYFRVFTNKNPVELALIYWYKKFNDWAFTTRETAAFEKDCLRDIIDFIENEIPKIPG